MNGRRTSSLVTVGDNCLDVYLTKNAMTVGGNALNVAVQWRRHGWASRYFGAVGRDPEGDVVLQVLQVAGLLPDDVERRTGDTAVTLLQERAGDRHFLLEDLGVGLDYMPSDEHYAIIGTADWVHLGTNANPDLVRRLVADGIAFSVDASTAHLALPLQGVPLLFASGPDEAEEAVGPLVQRLHAAGARCVVATCGSHGAYFSDGGALIHGPAKPVPVVDTCGAGDSFIAAFLAGYCVERRPVPEVLAEAAAAAAETCLHIGGFPQHPRPIPDWLLVRYADVIGETEA